MEAQKTIQNPGIKLINQLISQFIELLSFYASGETSELIGVGTCFVAIRWDLFCYRFDILGIFIGCWESSG